MTILQATEQDIQDIFNLVHTCYRGEESFKGWTTEANMLDGNRTTPDRIKREMNTPGSAIFKYTNESGELIGCVLAEHLASENKMHAGMLSVRPHLQGSGIGKKLMAGVADYAKTKNCKSVHIDVISCRETLVAWYERQGFKKTGEVQPFPPPTLEFGIPKKPLELIVLEKPVDYTN